MQHAPVAISVMGGTVLAMLVLMKCRQMVYETPNAGLSRYIQDDPQKTRKTKEEEIDDFKRRLQNVGSDYEMKPVI